MSENLSLCPICGQKLIAPAGRPSSPILLVGEFPGWKEIQKGTPFCGESGEVLKGELARVGIDWRYCRMTNLWLHEAPAKPKASPKITPDMLFYQRDRGFNLEQLVGQMATAKVILLMGSDVAELLVGKSISKINGSRVSSPYIPSQATAIAAYNPAMLLNRDSVVGDFRVALEIFASVAKPILMEALHG